MGIKNSEVSCDISIKYFTFASRGDNSYGFNHYCVNSLTIRSVKIKFVFDPLRSNTIYTIRTQYTQ